ncbi:MAG: hypothetical protein MRY72_08780 [Aquisalinus sp.]|nr:hypothetical protein [Aquisalinus sp.]
MLHFDNGGTIVPSAALAYFDAQCVGQAYVTSECGQVPVQEIPPLIAGRAANLGHDVHQIYEYIANIIDITPQFGVHGGANKIIIEETGTPFDVAQALYLMLEASDLAAGANYNPEYILGEIWLSETALANWLGTASVGESVELLAAGGFPVSASGAGATILTIFVSANVDGQVVVLNPICQDITRSAPIDVASFLSFDLSNLRQEVSSQSASPDTALNFDGDAIESILDSMRSALETEFISNYRGRRVDAILGERKIEPQIIEDVTPHSVSSSVTSRKVWPSSIPGEYNAKIVVRCENEAEGLVSYSDESYLTPILASCGQGYRAEVLVDHPYAYDGGVYQDRLTWRPAGHNAHMLAAWGKTSSRLKAWLSMVQQRDQELSSSGSHIFPHWVYDRVLHASYPAVFSKFIDFVSRAYEAKIIQHHALVSFYFENQTVTKHCQGIGCSNAGFSDAYINQLNTVTLVDFAAAVSGFGIDAYNQDSLPNLITLGLAFVESAVSKAHYNTNHIQDALSAITVRNSDDSSPPDYYLVGAGNISILQNDIENLPSSFLSEIETFIQSEGGLALLAKGGLVELESLFLSNDETPSPQQTMEYIYDQSDLSVAYLFYPGGGGAGLVAYNPGTGLTLKAGVGAFYSGEGEQSLAPLQLPDVTQRKPFFGNLSVDGKSGNITYSPPPDLVDGVGDFPEALALQRQFHGGDYSESGFGSGWAYNWDHNVRLSSDASAMFTGGNVHSLASALAAGLAIQDVLVSAYSSGTGALEAEDLAAGLFISHWLADQVEDNVATVASGLSGSELFYRQTNGAFLSAQNSGSQLVMTGTKGFANRINRFIYSDIDFTLTTITGEVRTYDQINVGLQASSDHIMSIAARPEFHLSQWSFPSGMLVNLDYQYALEDGFVSLGRVENSLGRYIHLKEFHVGETGGFPYCDENDLLYFTDPQHEMRRIYETSTERRAEYVQTMNYAIVFPFGQHVAITGDSGIREHDYVEGQTKGACAPYSTGGVYNVPTGFLAKRFDWRGILNSVTYPDNTRVDYKYEIVDVSPPDLDSDDPLREIGRLIFAGLGPLDLANPLSTGLQYVGEPVLVETAPAPDQNFILKFDYNDDDSLARVSSSGEIIRQTYQSSRFRNSTSNLLDERFVAFSDEHGQTVRREIPQ